MAHDEALGERFVHGHCEAPSQLGEPDQEQAQAVLGVHGEVGEICRTRHISPYAERLIMPRGASTPEREAQTS